MQAEQDNFGHQNGLVESQGNWQRTSNSFRFFDFRYRVIISKLPPMMPESDVMKAVIAVTSAVPKFTKFCTPRTDKVGDATCSMEKYLMLEFDQVEPTNALVEKLHASAPHYFDVKVSKRDPNIFKGKRGVYNSRRGNHSGYQQNHGNSGYNGGCNYYQSYRGGSHRVHMHNGCHRMQQPPLVPSPNENAAYPVDFSSPPMPQAYQGGFCAQPMGIGCPAPLIRMTEGQECMGCGSMTQLNCFTCFTPFCSNFCMNKFPDPSHPFDCQSLIVNTSPPAEMQQVPNFSAWYNNSHQMGQESTKTYYYNRQRHNSGTRGVHFTDNKDSTAEAADLTFGSIGSVSLSIEDDVKNLTLGEDGGLLKTSEPASVQVEKRVSPTTFKEDTKIPAQELLPKTHVASPLSKKHKQGNNYATRLPKVDTPPQIMIPRCEQLFTRPSAPPVVMNKMVQPPIPSVQMGPVMPNPTMFAQPPPAQGPIYFLMPNQQLMPPPLFEPMQHTAAVFPHFFGAAEQFDPQPGVPMGPPIAQQNFFWTNFQGYM